MHRNQHVDVPREQQNLNLAPQFLVQRSTNHVVDWVIGNGFDGFGQCFECLRSFQAACQQRGVGTLAVLPFLKDKIALRRRSELLEETKAAVRFAEDFPLSFAPFVCLSPLAPWLAFLRPITRHHWRLTALVG